MIAYRQMTAGDIPGALSLCRSAGWNQTAREWELFLQLSPKGCLVATRENNLIVGTVTTVNYDNRFSWIGMVLVDPALQRQGIGLRLLKESMQILEGNSSIKLDATPTGREVYLKLGFVDEYRLNRMQLNVNSAGNLPASSARLMQTADLADVMAFDSQVFGASRPTLLKWMFDGGPQFARVMYEGDKLTGYCLGRRGHNFIHVGPVIAHEPDTALQLVSAALQNCAGEAVIVDAIQFAPRWLKGLTSIGFVEQRPLIRMFHGSNTFPGIPGKQFAILGPEFG